ncbi:hypothetical protein BC629DRAFT_812260 [Irpex lacteus]|nr:hypothetical protein BC629DRAFT_812260 [Irpex lacteus]
MSRYLLLNAVSSGWCHPPRHRQTRSSYLLLLFLCLPSLDPTRSPMHCPPIAVYMQVDSPIRLMPLSHVPMSLLTPTVAHDKRCLCTSYISKVAQSKCIFVCFTTIVELLMYCAFKKYFPSLWCIVHTQVFLDPVRRCPWYLYRSLASPLLRHPLPPYLTTHVSRRVIHLSKSFLLLLPPRRYITHSSFCCSSSLGLMGSSLLCRLIHGL